MLAICTPPACMTASIAVARKTGGRGSGTRGRQPLYHPDFHPAVTRTPQRDVVHEAAHEEDAASARLQEVLRRQRVAHLVGVEALSLVEHPDDQLTGVVDRGERELHRDQ